MNKNVRQKGQFIIEMLLAMALMLVILPSLSYVFIASREGKPAQEMRTHATQMLQETYEIMRSIRERGWSYVSANGTYHPVQSGSLWTLAAGSEAVNDFTRSIIISDVYRTTSGQIGTQATGSLDPSTKLVTATVSWSTPRGASMSSSWYLTRYLGNSSFVHTTTADFTPGVTFNAQISSVAGGEITLANNNKAKWCTPSMSSTSIDLPDGPPVAVAATANANISIPNDVFVATAPSTSSAIKMAYLNVAANQDPPIASLRGIFTLDPAQYSSPSYLPSGIGLDNVFKTNDIKYYKSASNHVYALMTTNLPDKEVVAVQISNGSSDDYQDPVNKIYRYWTFFNTKIYGTAFNNPTANSAETSSAGDNNGYGSNPANAYVNDGSFAVDTNSGSNTGTSCTGSDKDKHRFYNYNLSIPALATINGIEIATVARVDSTTGTPKLCIQLSWDGGATWTSAKTTNNLTTSAATYTLGGSADTWDRTWSDADFTNANFRVRVINVASNTSRDFSLDSISVKVHYDGISSLPNDEEPFGYGAKALTVMGNRGYVSSGGYLYTFDLSTIDTKSPSNGLDQVGCRIQVDGYDCKPNSGTDRKYAAGEYGASWSDTTTPAHNDCSDGGNIELYASNDLYGVQVGGNNYIYVAVGAGTNPEFNIVNATSVPDQSSSPSIGNASCGRISGGNAGWKVVSSLDFNSNSGTEEAANSVFAKSDGTRAYISSNGGIDGNNDGQADSKQLYILDTSNKSSPRFLTGTSATGPQSGYYYGTGANAQLYPRRSLTVLNGQRAILVGKDGVTDGNDSQEYQVLNIDNEATPGYCGGVNFDSGFNDLTSVSEADGDNFVYMVANTTLNELKIIEGGPDTGLYLTPGTYESNNYTATSSVVFNRFSATINQPSQTTVKMQVASAPSISGSCVGVAFTYVGPNADPNAYYISSGNTISGTIPIQSYGGYQNPNQCFRYKVFMDTTDTNQTPTFSDMTVNFSP
jgi:hypothetical protein